MYRYGMLRTFIKLKLGLLALYTVVFMELSIYLENAPRLGTSIDYLLFLTFFLSIIYLAYASEIKRILKAEKTLQRVVEDD